MNRSTTALLAIAALAVVATMTHYMRGKSLPSESAAAPTTARPAVVRDGSMTAPSRGLGDFAIRLVAGGSSKYG
ncbi:MAG: hypothetical protein AAF961_11435, partial [Planctomycetota bacterium]